MISKQRAEAMGIEVLSWIAEDPERISAFLGATGASPEDLRKGSESKDFLGSVMDYLLIGDENVVSFCNDTGHRPEDVVAARASLPGGDLPNWT